MIQRTIDIKLASMAAFEKETKRLMIGLEEDRLLIALVEKDSSNWNALECFTMGENDWANMPETFQQVKQQSALANLRVPDVQLYYRTIKAMPVPTSLKSGNKLFLETQFGLQEPDETLLEEVNSSINVATIIPAEQVAALRHVFPQATWHSTLALLIRQAQQAQGNTILPQLFITISSSLAEIVLMKGNQLLIARCFPYLTAENLLYHLLNACNQLQVSPAETFIKAQGQIHKDDQNYQVLHDYFSHIELVTTIISKEFDEVPPHYFTHLMVEI